MTRYRLMKLAASGRVYEYASGNLKYLRHMSSLARHTAGRQWIEHPDQPAYIETSAAYRITRFLLNQKKGA